MKQELIKAEDAKLQSLPQDVKFTAEKLDFSELSSIKGGGDKDKDNPSGNSGQSFFGCSCG